MNGHKLRFAQWSSFPDEGCQGSSGNSIPKLSQQTSDTLRLLAIACKVSSRCTGRAMKPCERRPSSGRGNLPPRFCRSWRLCGRQLLAKLPCTARSTPSMVSSFAPSRHWAGGQMWRSQTRVHHLRVLGSKNTNCFFGTRLKVTLAPIPTFDW